MVVWTSAARRQLHELRQFIAQDSEMTADKVVKKLLQQSEKIASLPKIGREVPEFRRDDLREILVKPYRSIYRSSSCVRL